MAKRSAKKGGVSSDDEKIKVTKTGLKQALKVLTFILPYRGVFLTGMLFLILSTGTALIVPYLAGVFLDVALEKTYWIFTSIRNVVIVFAFMLLLQSVFSFFRIYLFAIVSEKSMADIRATLYTKIISLPLEFFEKKRVGELNSRITADVNQLQDALSFTIAEFFRQIATIMIGTTVLFIHSAQLTLFMMATFPVLVFFAIFFGRFIRKIAKKSQDMLAKSNIVVEETLQSVQAVKAFTNELFEVRRYKTALDGVVYNTIQVARFRGLFTSFVIMALFGGLMLVLAYGASLVAQKVLSVGELTSFIIYSAFIGGSMGGMSELYGQLQKAIGASERILEILEEDSEVALSLASLDKIESVTSSIKGSIHFENVQFAYPTRSDIKVLKGISMNIDQGQKIALVGHSGVGKSTIIQLLGRYYSPQSGCIKVDSQDIQEMNLTHLRQNIGIVPQEVILFGGTIRENILYGKPDASEEEIIEAARKANAWTFIQEFPEKLDTVVGERGIKLSGGQRQRIAIARAILKNPAILILDEATSSLDAKSERLIQQALEELMQNRTTIIIAHRLATIRKVDRIYVIHDGKISETGSHQELVRNTTGIYSNLVKLQFESESS